MRPDTELPIRRGVRTPIGDQIFLCSDYRVAREPAEASAPVYRYIFDDEPTITFPPLGENPGAYHGAELAYVFGETVESNGIPLAGLGPSDRLLSRRMQRYWTNSAATGDPNDDGWFAPPEWPRVGDDYERVWLLEHEVRVETSVQPECELSGDVYEAITAP